MKRRVFLRTFLALAFAFMIILNTVSVEAASPSYTAKCSTPTLDGVVSSGEYGAAVDFNKSNLSIFYYNWATDDPTTANANFPDLTYSFAWDEENLYVGITAKNLANVSDTQFQIDLSPNKKIADGKAGIFYTFRIIRVGELVSVARANYNQANISKKCQTASREVTSGVYNLEVAIPLAELQVSGPNGDFSSLKLKSGTWGVGCYMVGNDAGWTNTVGANNNEAIGYNAETGNGNLIQYYNTLTLAEKPVVDAPSDNNTSNDNSNNNNNNNNNNTNNNSNNNTNNNNNNHSNNSNTSNNDDVSNDNNSDTTNNNDVTNNTQTTEIDESLSDSTESLEDVENTEETTQDTNATVDKDDNDSEKESPLMTVCIVLAVLIVFSAIIGAILILKKPKKTNK